MMKKSLAVTIIAVTVAACTPAVDTNSTTAGIVASVIDVQDGDSLLVDIDDTEERVRLIGVNAPERDECFGSEAAAVLRDLIDGAKVRIVTDLEERDQYGRLLVYLYREKTLINEEIARRGLVLARAFEPNIALQDRIDAAANDARDNQRGMWSPTTCASATAASLAVTDIEPDPPGPDESNLSGEWAVIANESDNEIDLSGWILRDASSVHRYVFPAGTTLGPSANLIVYTGCGADDPGRKYWCAEGPVWDNSGDSALLLDHDGRIAATFYY